METQNQNWQSVSEIELIYRTKIKASQRPQIKSSREAYRLILSTWDFNKIELLEQFKVVFLNQANRALGIIELSSGGISSTIIDVRLVFSAVCFRLVFGRPSKVSKKECGTLVPLN
ncbi:JAB domain-containing protein [Flavobacterium aquiphilum]|uniref:JAB domain-containing protein n=1 Tax=Flavobacterium aquiphilum TaxID=3003261 RepID=UPI0024803932|nr:JAB domain-containing protein [Flavobacterium aquiphilum]